MKRTCGIELKGNDAIIVVIEGTKNDYTYLQDCSIKITLSDANSQTGIKLFHKKCKDFFVKYNIEKVGIKARATKGRFAGGAISFKMESLLQTINTSVEIIHGKTVASKLKEATIDYSNLKKYQQEAMNMAYYLLD